MNTIRRRVWDSVTLGDGKTPYKVRALTAATTFFLIRECLGTIYFGMIYSDHGMPMYKGISVPSCFVFDLVIKTPPLTLGLEKFRFTNSEWSQLN